MTTIQLNGDYSLVKGSKAPEKKKKVVSSFFHFMGEEELKRYVTGDNTRGFTNYSTSDEKLKTLGSTKESFATALAAVGISNIKDESFTIFVN